VSSKLASGGTAVYVLERTAGTGTVHVWKVADLKPATGRAPTLEEAVEAGLARRGFHSR
jgi:hypothetical protein